MTDAPRIYISTITAGLTPEYRALPKPHPGAVAYVPEEAGVRVKPLVWTKVTDESYRVDSLIGRYYAYKADGFWRTYRDANGSWVHPKDELSLVAAQAAAHADYEARIMAALEPMEPSDE